MLWGTWMAKGWKPRGEIDLDGAIAGLLPYQRQFIGAPNFAVAAVGGQGSGKSVVLCISAILNALRDPGGFSLMGRLNYPALESSTMKTFLELVPERCGDWKPTPKEFHYTNGHVTTFKHLDITDPKVAGHIKSMNLSGAFIDEATEINEETYLLITGRIRRKTAPMHLLRLASNPAGRDWVWRWFFDPNRKPALMQNLGINMSTFDNVHLPSDRVENWKATYPVDWADRYLHGHFSDFSDVIYKEFTDVSHVWDSRQQHEIFGGLSDPPADWPVIIGIDIGSDTEHDPWAIVLISVAPDGRLYQFDELYGNGLLIASIADQLFTKLGDRGRPDVAYDYAQRQCAMELAECGIVGQPAIKEVDPGIFKVAQYVHIDDRLPHPFNPRLNGSPRYFVSSRCERTVSAITAYQWAKDRSGNPTGKPAHEHSHVPDAIRYAIHTFRPLPEKPRAVALWEQPHLTPLSAAFWKDEARKPQVKEGNAPLLRFKRANSNLFRRPAVAGGPRGKASV